MAKTHTQEMETYFKFIERYYICEDIEIENKHALELYKVILESVKGPMISLRDETIPTNRSLRQ
jgi:hypothetical protein